MEQQRPLAVVVLAAGKGTRMKSGLHKVLHPLGGRPMLLHLLDTVGRLGAARTVVVVGDKAEQVERALAGTDCLTAVQSPQLGTGHAVLQARAALDGFEGDLLVLFGDVPLLPEAPLRALREAVADGAAAALLAFRPAVPGAYGRVIVEGGAVRMVEAKDASPQELACGLCNSGVLLMRAPAAWGWLEAIGDDNAAGEYYLPDAVMIAQRDGARVAVVEADAQAVTGVNSRAELAAAEAMFQAVRREELMAAGVTLRAPETVFVSWDTEIEADVTVEPFVVFGPGVRVARGATIKAHSSLEGAEVGEDCKVGPFARLRPGTVLGVGAKVGNFVETKKAVLGDGAKASHLTYLGDCEVGAAANIGAGTITCNYDGYGKHRTVIGERAFIGSNTALVAPVRVGADAIVGAGSTVTADVAAGDLALARGRQEAKPGWAARFHAAMRARKAK